MSGNFNFLLFSKVMTMLVKRMHVLNAKFNCVSETNQTSNQNFPTPFFKGRCQEDIAILIAFSRSNPTGNELD